MFSNAVTRLANAVSLYAAGAYKVVPLTEPIAVPDVNVCVTVVAAGIDNVTAPVCPLTEVTGAV